MLLFVAFTTTTKNDYSQSNSCPSLQTTLKTHLCHDVYKNLTMVRQMIFCNCHLLQKMRIISSLTSFFYLLFVFAFVNRDYILLYVPNMYVITIDTLDIRNIKETGNKIMFIFTLKCKFSVRELSK